MLIYGESALREKVSNELFIKMISPQARRQKRDFRFSDKINKIYVGSLKLAGL
jgi:hypothetical protein